MAVLQGESWDGGGSGESHYGTKGNDALSGAGGADSIHGGMGNDTIFGGDGDDSIFDDFGDDWLIGGAGSDTILFHELDSSVGSQAYVNYDGVVFDMTKHVVNLGVLGTDIIYGFENIFGSYGDDKFYGDDGINSISGNLGSDYIDGRGGNDLLQGGAGVDTVVGGKGADQLAGDDWASLSDDNAQDVFKYSSTSESGTTALTRDTIQGSFNTLATTTDKIDLHAIDADGKFKAGNGTFKFIGDHAFTKGVIGEVQVLHGANVYEYIVNIDTDKDNSPEMTIVVDNWYQTAPLKGDFIL